jgi:formylglycine-generating enzyme required for sulfatase activity
VHRQVVRRVYHRVVRGATWGGFPRHARSAGRYWSSVRDRSESLGFRLARTLNP